MVEEVALTVSKWETVDSEEMVGGEEKDREGEGEVETLDVDEGDEEREAWVRVGCGLRVREGE